MTATQLWPEQIRELEKLKADRQVSFNAALRMAVEAGLKSMSDAAPGGDVMARLALLEAELADLRTRLQALERRE